MVSNNLVVLIFLPQQQQKDFQSLFSYWMVSRVWRYIYIVLALCIYITQPNLSDWPVAYLMEASFHIFYFNFELDNVVNTLSVLFKTTWIILYYLWKASKLLEILGLAWMSALLRWTIPLNSFSVASLEEISIRLTKAMRMKVKRVTGEQAKKG